MTVTTQLSVLALRSHESDWNYARWEQLPEDGNRYEVIDGVLYMTTAPSSFHQWIVRRLDRFVGIPLEDQNLAFVFTAPIGVLMPGCDPVQPDFVVVRREQQDIIRDRRIYGVPALLVEVVSPGNAEQDTRIKRSAYARAGVPEYWIVRPDTRSVLICGAPDPLLEDYTSSHLAEEGDDLVAATLPVRIPVAALFAGAPDTSL
jgi:Uma2 family endonuclease